MDADSTEYKKQTTFKIVIIKGSLRVGVTGFEPATTWSQTRTML